MIRPAALTALLGASLWAQPAGIEGDWSGTLDTGAVKLRIGLHIKRDAQGQFSSTLDSLDQGALGIPVKVTTFSAGKLHFEMPNLNASYDGTLSADGGEIKGTFTQGMPLPLTFKRGVAEAPKRPQEPRPPFPYEAVDVSYENKTGTKFAGTLTVPRGQGPFPAVLMITGSGPQDRDETLMGHKPFLLIADSLTRRGIAVLRVDDRGMGGSTGKSSDCTLEDMVVDVLAGIDFLKARKEIDPRRIGVAGHSEGGLVGPLAATRSSDIAFVVMLAGTGVDGKSLLALQQELVARSMGATAEAIAINTEVRRLMFSLIDTEKDAKAAVEKMKLAWARMKESAPEEKRKLMAAADANIEGGMAALMSPELRSFLLYDPAPTLRKLKVPVLAMNGARDIQVPPSQNLPAIMAALAEAGNSDVTIVELPGLNHLFQKCQACTIVEYGTLEETFSPDALAIMGDWLARHTRAQ